MTRYAILTLRGAAGFLAKELAELGIATNEEGPEWCSAELDQDQLATIRLRCQIATKVLELIAVTDRDSLLKLAQELRPSGSFCVRASGTDRQELELLLGECIFEHSKAPVNLTKPDVLYYAHETGGQYLFGIAVYPDLSKRHYKIITGSQSVTGPFAAATLRLAGWEPKQDLVVWPCTTGELAIEAALWATGKSPRAYELQDMSEHKPACAILAADPKLSMVRSCEKNAKVAGVHQHIRFSRQDLDWLDTKHDQQGVTCLVGVLPNLKLYPKFVNELFYQLDYILAGSATFICPNEVSAALLEQRQGYTASRAYLWLGKQAMTIVTLRSQKRKTEAKA